MMLNKTTSTIICILLSTYVLAASKAFAESKTLGNITGGAAYETPSWFTNSFLDINEEVIEAKESNKNIMLFFHLDDCPYCEYMINENFSGGSTTKFIQDKFSVIALNIKGDREVTINETSGITEKKLSQQLKVQYTPTIIFINSEGEIVYRINGYRSATAFKQVLDYVSDKGYKKMKLSSYIESRNTDKKDTYNFISHKSLQKVSYFNGYKKPVAILFEDKDCSDCEFLHKSVINQKQVLAEIDKLLFVRLDAYSDSKVVDFNGKVTTPRKWANDLALNYRPGIVFFDEQKEIVRVDGRLFSFHLKEVFRYVSGKFYKKYNSYSAYLAVRQKELVNIGVDIDIIK